MRPKIFKPPILASNAKHAQKRGDWLTRIGLDPNVKATSCGTATLVAHIFWHQGKNRAWMNLDDVAQLANMNRKSIERHLRELTKAGYLRSVQKGNGNEAERFFMVDFANDWLIFETEILRKAKMYPSGADATYVREQTHEFHKGHRMGQDGTGPSDVSNSSVMDEGDNKDNTLNHTLNGAFGNSHNLNGEVGPKGPTSPHCLDSELTQSDIELESDSAIEGHALEDARPANQGEFAFDDSWFEDSWFEEGPV